MILVLRVSCFSSIPDSKSIHIFCSTQGIVHLTHLAESARIHGDRKSYTFDDPSQVNLAA
jgi:hypothetical protein